MKHNQGNNLTLQGQGHHVYGQTIKHDYKSINHSILASTRSKILLVRLIILLLRMALTVVKYSCIDSEHCSFPYNRSLVI